MFTQFIHEILAFQKSAGVDLFVLFSATAERDIYIDVLSMGRPVVHNRCTLETVLARIRSLKDFSVRDTKCPFYGC